MPDDTSPHAQAGRTRKGPVAELRHGTQTRRRQQRDVRASARRAGAVVRGPRRPLEARRHRRASAATAAASSAATPTCPRSSPRSPQFHTMRVNQPSGWFYTTDTLRTDLRHLGEARVGADQPARRHGRHHPARHEDRVARAGLRRPDRNGFDLGGSGSVVRTPSCCVGPARCEWACFDTLASDLRHHAALPGRAAPPDVPLQVQDQGVGLPQRLRGRDRRAPTSASSAPGAARSASTRSRSRRMPRAAWTSGAEVVRSVPHDVHGVGRARRLDDRQQHLRNSCMHCINVMPKALRPGPRTRRVHPDRRQGAHRPGAMLSCGARAVHED